ncbi:MAG: hypothetical protein P1U87_21060, partial [Verrucomicrobiales bacterium]|nr:hypothetical protein [Verrucomicrobiales bacterium]
LTLFLSLFSFSMDDVPWLYVAMIFIAFVSWVSNRIKEAAEYRRERKAARAAASRSRQTSGAPEWDSPYRDEPVEETPQTFTDIYREIEKQFTEAAQPKTSSPPPLPEAAQSESSDEPMLGAMPELPDGPVKTAPPLTVQKVKRRKSRSDRNSSISLVDSLRAGPRLRNAIILREVLDKPKALQRRGPHL